MAFVQDNDAILAQPVNQLFHAADIGCAFFGRDKSIVGRKDNTFRHVDFISDVVRVQECPGDMPGPYALKVPLRILVEVFADAQPKCAFSALIVVVEDNSGYLSAFSNTSAIT